jgi:serine/threonine protein kinase
MAAPVPARAQIGRYELVTPLGQGGMARVYVALHRGPLGFDKLVVVKQVRPELASDREFLHMFFDEARIAVRLNHRNVVQTYEALEADGQYILAMEYLEGHTLSDVLRRVGRLALPLSEHLWILSQVLAGLQYAHELRDFDGKPLGVVHRDVSPSNVLITYNGDVKLLDFGVAKAAGAVSVTHKGMVKGKLAYGAPEQFIGQPVDRRADIFSVGVMMWEALARRRRKLAETPAATFGALMTRPLRIREVAPNCPEWLASVCDRAVSVDPNERFATAAEFQAEIDGYLEHTGHRVERRELTSLMHWYFDQDRVELSKRIEDLLVRPTPSTAPRASLESSGQSSAPAATVSDVAVGSAPRSRISAIPDFRPAWVRHGAAAFTALAIGTLAIAATVQRHVAGPASAASSEAVVASMAAMPPPVPSPSARSLETSAVDPTLVWLSVKATPPTATVFLDNRQLAANPFRAEVTKDSRVHLLRATAPGFKTAERVVSFASDVDLEITLHDITTSAPRIRKAEAPAPDAAAAAIEETIEKDE